MKQLGDKLIWDMDVNNLITCVPLEEYIQWFTTAEPRVNYGITGLSKLPLNVYTPGTETHDIITINQINRSLISGKDTNGKEYHLDAVRELMLDGHPVQTAIALHVNDQVECMIYPVRVNKVTGGLKPHVLNGVCHSIKIGIVSPKHKALTFVYHYGKATYFKYLQEIMDIVTHTDEQCDRYLEAMMEKVTTPAKTEKKKEEITAKPTQLFISTLTTNLLNVFGDEKLEANIVDSNTNKILIGKGKVFNTKRASYLANCYPNFSIEKDKIGCNHYKRLMIAVDYAMKDKLISPSALKAILPDDKPNTTEESRFQIKSNIVLIDGISHGPVRYVDTEKARLYHIADVSRVIKRKPSKSGFNGYIGIPSDLVVPDGENIVIGRFRYVSWSVICASITRCDPGTYNQEIADVLMQRRELFGNKEEEIKNNEIPTETEHIVEEQPRPNKEVSEVEEPDFNVLMRWAKANRCSISFKFE